jgi:hypothetical protein
MALPRHDERENIKGIPVIHETGVIIIVAKTVKNSNKH